jgi:hypothetical protein
VSLVTPLEVKPNIGWKATASAPTVQAHGVLGSSSRRKRKTQSTVIAASSAENRRRIWTRSGSEVHGERW